MAASLHTYVPSVIVEQLLDDEKPAVVAPELHSFRTVCLFADVSGFTALSEAMSKYGHRGPEHLTKHLNSYFEQLVRLIAGQGGDVFKFAGDALIVLWPDNAEEDIPTRTRRAAQCAMDIQSNLHKAKLAEGVTLSVKVGIGVGDVTVLHIGGVMDRMEYLATGDALLQAFAAEHCASPGDVYLSSAAYSLISDFVECVPAEGHDEHEAEASSSSKTEDCPDGIPPPPPPRDEDRPRGISAAKESDAAEALHALAAVGGAVAAVARRKSSVARSAPAGPSGHTMLNPLVAAATLSPAPLSSPAAHSAAASTAASSAASAASAAAAAAAAAAVPAAPAAAAPAGHAPSMRLLRVVETLRKVSVASADLMSRLELSAYAAPKIRMYIARAALARELNPAFCSELRRVTVMFVNLGFSEDELAALHTPEAAMKVHVVLTAVQEALYQYEGALNKFLMDDKGSTLVAAFGLPPLAHEDDGTRAVLSSLQICAKLFKLGREARVGITTGTVFCGVVGSRTRREYSLLGDTVNLSARLMQQAIKTQCSVLCDLSTKHAVRSGISFDRLPEITVKGKKKGVKVFRPYPLLTPIEQQAGSVSVGAAVSRSGSSGAVATRELCVRIVKINKYGSRQVRLFWVDAAASMLRSYDKEMNMKKQLPLASMEHMQWTKGDSPKLTITFNDKSQRPYRCIFPSDAALNKFVEDCLAAGDGSDGTSLTRRLTDDGGMLERLKEDVGGGDELDTAARTEERIRLLLAGSSGAGVSRSPSALMDGIHQLQLEGYMASQMAKLSVHSKTKEVSPLITVLPPERRLSRLPTAVPAFASGRSVSPSPAGGRRASSSVSPSLLLSLAAVSEEGSGESRTSRSLSSSSLRGTTPPPEQLLDTGALIIHSADVHLNGSAEVDMFIVVRVGSRQFRTSTLRHCTGGDWDLGGSVLRELPLEAAVCINVWDERAASIVACAALPLSELVDFIPHDGAQLSRTSRLPLVAHGAAGGSADAGPIGTVSVDWQLELPLAEEGERSERKDDSARTAIVRLPAGGRLELTWGDNDTWESLHERVLRDTRRRILSMDIEPLRLIYVPHAVKEGALPEEIADAGLIDGLTMDGTPVPLLPLPLSLLHTLLTGQDVQAEVTELHFVLEEPERYWKTSAHSHTQLLCALLSQKIDILLKRESSPCILRGPPGIGKSWLLSQWALLAHPVEVVLVAGDALVGGQRLQIWKSVLLQLCELLLAEEMHGRRAGLAIEDCANVLQSIWFGDDDDDIISDDEGDDVDDADSPPLDDIAAALAFKEGQPRPRALAVLNDVLGMHLEESSLTRRMTAEQVEEAQSIVLLQLLKLLTVDYPVLLAVDNVEYIDADSRTLLLRAAKQVPQVGLLLSARSGVYVRELDEMATLPGCQQLSMDGLTPKDMESLLIDGFGCPVDAAVLDVLAEKSTGNPLVLKELAHEVLRVGMVVVDDGRVSVADGGAIEASALPLPQIVQCLVAAALDRLPGLQQLVVKSMAVAMDSTDSSSVTLTMLLHVVPGVASGELLASDVEEAVVQLERSNLLRRERSSHEAHFLFVQGFVVEVVLQTLLESQLEPLRRRAMHFLEQMSIDQHRLSMRRRIDMDDGPLREAEFEVRSDSLSKLKIKKFQFGAKKKREAAKADWWKVRWITLGRNVITLYRARSDRKPAKVLHLSTATLSILEDEDMKHNHCFQLHTPHWTKGADTFQRRARYFVFSHRDADVIKDWTVAIRLVIEQLNKKTVGVRHREDVDTISGKRSASPTDSTKRGASRFTKLELSPADSPPLPPRPTGAPPPESGLLPPPTTRPRRRSSSTVLREIGGGSPMATAPPPSVILSKPRTNSGLTEVAVPSDSAGRPSSGGRRRSHARSETEAALSMLAATSDSVGSVVEESSAGLPEEEQEAGGGKEGEGGMQGIIAGLQSLLAQSKGSAMEGKLTQLLKAAITEQQRVVHLRDSDIDEGMLLLEEPVVKLPVEEALGVPWSWAEGGLHVWSLDVAALPASLQSQMVVELLTFWRASEVLRGCTTLKLHNFMAALRTGYGGHPYHNFAHGCDVAHATHIMLHRFQATPQLSPLESVALLLAAVAHDVNHPGVNNAFLVNSRAPLALRYSDDSVLERHHAAYLFGTVLARPAADVLSQLPQAEWKVARRIMLTSILATDMASHFSLNARLQEAAPEGEPALLPPRSLRELASVDESKLPDEKFRLLLASGILHAADISNVSRPFHIAEAWTRRVMTEFHAQGDREQLLGLPVSPLCDRKKAELAKDSLGFIDIFVAPLFAVMVLLLPGMSVACQQLARNRSEWERRMHAEAAGAEEAEEASKREWEKRATDFRTSLRLDEDDVPVSVRHGRHMRLSSMEALPRFVALGGDLDDCGVPPAAGQVYLKLSSSPPQLLQLEAGNEYSIGVADGCALRLPAFPSAGSKHAIISAGEDGSIVYSHQAPLPSVTLIDGRPLQWGALLPGDELEIAGLRLTVHAGSHAAL